MSKKIRYGLLILLPTFLFLGLFSTVEAQEATPDVRPLHGRRGLLGQITGIDSSTLTVETPVGQLAIHTDEETHFRIIGQEDAGLDDLSPGDQVFIRGIRRDDGQLLARLIILRPTGDLVVGRIISLADDSLRLRALDAREVLVNASPDTIVVSGPQELTWEGEPAGRDALREGMRLIAFGARSEDGTNLETHTLISHRPQRPIRGVAGEIMEIEGDGFVLQALRGAEVTILTTAETRFRNPEVDGPALQDLSVGDLVAVVGRPTGDAEISALLVTAVAEVGPRGRPLLGRIDDITNQTIIVNTRQGRQVNILTNASTHFRVGDDTGASLDDFSAGDNVVVFVKRAPETDGLVATHVMKRG